MQHPRIFPLLCLICCLSTAGVAQTSDTLTILHLNDTHSCLAPAGPRNALLEGQSGGVARAASIIGAAKMRERNVLTLHAGDYSIGDIFYNLYFGVAELKILQQLGVDAIALGNHEFDLTPVALQASLDTAFAQGTPIPMLSANLVLDDPGVQGLKRWVKPFVIKQYGGMKVGIFGLTTPATNLLSQPSPAFVDTLVLETALATVGELQAANCSVIICLSHLGVFYDEMLASFVPGIDLIIGGHDHLTLFEPMENIAGDTTWIAQADAFYSRLGTLKIVSAGGKARIIAQGFIPLDASVPEEPAVAAAVNLLKQDIAQRTQIPFFSQKVTVANAFFAEVPDSLTFKGYHDTPVGNLVTDAFRAFGKSDVAIEAGGSTAQPLYPGPITLEDIFRVVGYGFNTVNGLGFRMVTFDLTGAGLAAGLEFGVSDIASSDEFLLQSSGLNYLYDPGKPPGQRILGATVGGVPLDPAKTYSVTANEFAVKFLQYLGIPFGNLKMHGDTTEFMVLAGYMSRFPSGIDPVRRASVVAPVRRDESVLPSTMRLEQNYPNPFGTGGAQSGTTIAFELPGAADVTLKVYDLLGREAATILDARLQAGRYALPYTAPNLPAGTYAYRLKAGSMNLTRKMVVVR